MLAKKSCSLDLTELIYSQKQQENQVTQLHMVSMVKTNISFQGIIQDEQSLHLTSNNFLSFE
jgi:hypothetical protein